MKKSNSFNATGTETREIKDRRDLKEKAAGRPYKGSNKDLTHMTRGKKRNAFTTGEKKRSRQQTSGQIGLARRRGKEPQA